MTNDQRCKSIDSRRQRLQWVNVLYNIADETKNQTLKIFPSSTYFNTDNYKTNLI